MLEEPAEAAWHVCISYRQRVPGLPTWLDSQLQHPAEDCSTEPTAGAWDAAPTARATRWVGTTTEWS